MIKANNFLCKSLESRLVMPEIVFVFSLILVQPYRGRQKKENQKKMLSRCCKRLQIYLSHSKLKSILMNSIGNSDPKMAPRKGKKDSGGGEKKASETCLVYKTKSKAENKENSTTREGIMSSSNYYPHCNPVPNNNDRRIPNNNFGHWTSNSSHCQETSAFLFIYQ